MPETSTQLLSMEAASKYLWSHHRLYIPPAVLARHALNNRGEGPAFSRDGGAPVYTYNALDIYAATWEEARKPKPSPKPRRPYKRIVSYRFEPETEL